MGQDTTIAHGNQGKLHLGALRRLIVKAIMSAVEGNGDFVTVSYTHLTLPTNREV